MALKVLSTGFLKTENEKVKFDQITIKILGRPCLIEFSSQKHMAEFKRTQKDDPQLLSAALLNIDLSNIKVPNVPPKKPKRYYTYVPEFRTALDPFDRRYDIAKSKHWDREWAAEDRDNDRNEREAQKYEEAMAKFSERVRNAKDKIHTKKNEIMKEFESYTFYVYKENLYYFNKPDIHSQEDRQLLVKKYYVKEMKKLDRFQKELQIIERLASEPELAREPIPEAVRMFVWRRDGGKCVKCGSKENLEFDHIIPVSKGGSNTERNIQILCEHCNREKSDKI